MSKYKLSPWHDGSVKPVHVGVYEIGGNEGGAFQYWNGKWWALLCPSIRYAVANKDFKSYFQHKKWRGILKE